MKASSPESLQQSGFESGPDTAIESHAGVENTERSRARLRLLASLERLGTEPDERVLWRDQSGQVFFNLQNFQAKRSQWMISKDRPYINGKRITVADIIELLAEQGRHRGRG